MRAQLIYSAHIQIQTHIHIFIDDTPSHIKRSTKLQNSPFFLSFDFSFDFLINANIGSSSLSCCFSISSRSLSSLYLANGLAISCHSFSTFFLNSSSCFNLDVKKIQIRARLKRYQMTHCFQKILFIVKQIYLGKRAFHICER